MQAPIGRAVAVGRVVVLDGGGRVGAVGTAVGVCGSGAADARPTTDVSEVRTAVASFIVRAVMKG